MPDHKGGFDVEETETRTDLPVLAERASSKAPTLRPPSPTRRPPAKSGVSFARSEEVAVANDDPRLDPFEDIRISSK
jgi:hypothetical protein